jgi:hypothetical protein
MDEAVKPEDWRKSESDIVARYNIEIPTAKSLYIETRCGETVLGNATGFLAANDQQSHCALITNRHVVTGRHQDTGECLHSQGGIPDNVVIYFHKNAASIGDWKPIALPLFRPDGSPYWIEHPRLGGAADVVALNLNWANDVWKFPYYMKTPLDRPDLVLGPADTVSVIGFPFGLSSVARFPVWATGFLAQELSLMTADNPVFLIDCRTRQGQSGSAVIAYRAGTYRTRNKEGRVQSTLSRTPTWEFLGIYSNRVNKESDLGKVWHVRAVEEVLTAAAADMQARNAAAADRSREA